MHDAKLSVSAADRSNRRLVIISHHSDEFSDRLDLDDAWRREHFARRASDRFGWPADNQWLVDAMFASAADAAGAVDGRPRARIRRVANVTTRPVDWLWPGRAAVGKLTLLAGDPGLGKSFVTLDLAARVSRGRPLPGSCHTGATAGLSSSEQRDQGRTAGQASSGTQDFSLRPADDSPRESEAPVTSRPDPADVLLVNCEDDLADTVAPRLVAAGADLSRISMLEGVLLADDGNAGAEREDSFSLVEHLTVLDDALAALRRPRLLVIDPISAFLRGVDTHRNADVRSALAPLAALAQRRNVAVIAVTHLAKNTHGPAVHRAMGSLAFAAAARAVWMIVRDPDDHDRRLLLPAKNNLGPDATGLSFCLEQDAGDAQPRVAWDSSPVALSADQLSEGIKQTPRPTPRRNQAREWLAEMLADGPMPAGAVFHHGRIAGHGRDALRAALADLGGYSARNGAGAYFWQLPTTGATAGLSSSEALVPLRTAGQASSGTRDETSGQNPRLTGDDPRPTPAVARQQRRLDDDAEVERIIAASWFEG